jgi:hypothetical protein
MASPPRACPSSSRQGDVQLLSSTPADTKKALARSNQNLHDQNHRLKCEMNEAVNKAVGQKKKAEARAAQAEARAAQAEARAAQAEARADHLENVLALPDTDVDTVRVFVWGLVDPSIHLSHNFSYLYTSIHTTKQVAPPSFPSPEVVRSFDFDRLSASTQKAVLDCGGCGIVCSNKAPATNDAPVTNESGGTDAFSLSDGEGEN